MKNKKDTKKDTKKDLQKDLQKDLKKDTTKDPHQSREASKYQNPVVSREFILEYMEELDRPTTLQHLLEAFSIEGAEEQEGLRRRLLAMVRDGQLITNRRGSY